MKFQGSAFGRWVGLIALLGLISAGATGHAAEDTVTVSGKPLKLIGSGLREFLFIDIYRMSAYSESGDCRPGKIVYKNEIKTLRLAMLKTLPASRMQSNMRGTLEDTLPEDKDNSALQKKIDTFISFLDKDVKSGSYVELTYIPGKGTLIKNNGKRVGTPIPGKDFADLLWKAYFGGNTCCSSLKASILKACQKKQ